MAASNQRLIPGIAAVSVTLGTFLCAETRAEPQHEFLVFPSLEYRDTADESDDSVNGDGELMNLESGSEI